MNRSYATVTFPVGRDEIVAAVAFLAYEGELSYGGDLYLEAVWPGRTEVAKAIENMFREFGVHATTRVPEVLRGAFFATGRDRIYKHAEDIVDHLFPELRKDGGDKVAP